MYIDLYLAYGMIWLACNTMDTNTGENWNQRGVL